MRAAVMRLRLAQILLIAAIATAVVSAYVVLNKIVIVRRDYQDSPTAFLQILPWHLELRSTLPAFVPFEEVI